MYVQFIKTFMRIRITQIKQFCELLSLNHCCNYTKFTESYINSSDDFHAVLDFEFSRIIFRLLLNEEVV